MRAALRLSFLHILPLAFGGWIATTNTASASCPEGMALRPLLRCMNDAIASLKDENADLQAEIEALQTDEIFALSDYVTVDEETHGVHFVGANVYVQSGSGSTAGEINGLGNLIVGYDESGSLWSDSPFQNGHYLADENHRVRPFAPR